MGLGFERDDGVNGALGEEVGAVRVDGVELADARALDKSHIILVGRYEAVRVGLRSLLDEFEERRRLLLAVDDKSAVEDFMAAVLGVDLREAKHLTIGERATQAPAQLAQILLLVGAKGEAFRFVVFGDIVDIHYWYGLGGQIED